MINSFQTLTLNRRQPKRQTLFGETGGSQTSTKNKVLGGTGLSMAAAALLQVISPSVASAEALPADTESTLDQFQASSNNANYRETIRDIAFSLFNQQAPFDANVGNFHVQEGQYLEHIAAAVISINPDYNISELHDLVQAISTHNELGNPDVLRTNANNGVLNLTPFLTSAAVANNAQDQEYSGPVKTIEIARAGDQLPWDVAVDIADDYSMPLDDVFAIITALNPDLIERSNNGQLGVDEAYTIQVPDYQELTIETINTSGVYPWHVAERIAENQDRDLGDVLDAIEALNEEVFNQANAGTLSAPYNLVLPNDFIDVAVPDDVVEYQPGAGVTLSDVAEVASRNDNALSYQEALEIIKTLNPNEFANATRLPADYTILIPATFIVDADMTSESPVTNDSSHYGDLVEHQPGLGVTLSEVADRAAANNDELSYSQALDIIEELNPEAFANARRLPANYSITIPSSFLENSVLNNVGTSRLLEAPLYGSLEVASLSPDEAGVASNDLNEQLETVTASINELEEIVTTSEEAIPVAEQTLNEAEAALAVVEPELLEDIDTKEEEIADTEAEITEIRGGSEPISESVEFGLPLAGGFELFDLAGTVGEFGDRPNQNETGYIPGATDPHTGWDFGLPTGTPIQAVLDGTVIDLHRENSGRGFSITLQHANGFFSQYNHLNFNDGIYVENGDTVTAGQEIGEVGNTGVSTGPHLDLKIWGPDSDIIPDMVNRIKDERLIEGKVPHHTEGLVYINPEWLIRGEGRNLLAIDTVALSAEDQARLDEASTNLEQAREELALVQQELETARQNVADAEDNLNELVENKSQAEAELVRLEVIEQETERSLMIAEAIAELRTTELIDGIPPQEAAFDRYLRDWDSVIPVGEGTVTGAGITVPKPFKTPEERDAFKQAVLDLAQENGWVPDYLMAVFRLETANTFSPAIQNSHGATGLIQFYPDSNGNYNTGNESIAVDTLAQMSPIEQLEWVKKHFRNNENALNVHVQSLTDHYTVVFYPAAIGADPNSELPGYVHNANSGFDRHGNQDGRLQIREIGLTIRAIYDQVARLPESVAPAPSVNETGVAPDVTPEEFIDNVRSAFVDVELTEAVNLLRTMVPDDFDRHYELDETGAFILEMSNASLEVLRVFSIDDTGLVDADSSVHDVTPSLEEPPAEVAPEPPPSAETTITNVGEPAVAHTQAEFFDLMRESAALEDGYFLPVFQEGSLVSELGVWHSDRAGRSHQGIDFYVPAVGHPDRGTLSSESAIPLQASPVFAPIGGEIVRISGDRHDDSSAGNFITFRGDDGLYYQFLHLADQDNFNNNNAPELSEEFSHLLNFNGGGLEVGDRIEAGETIGFVGDTGGTIWEHLHFEIKTSQSGGHINPLDISAGAPEALVNGLIKNIYFEEPTDFHGEPGLTPDQAAHNLGLSLRSEPVPVGSLAVLETLQSQPQESPNTETVVDTPSIFETDDGFINGAIIDFTEADLAEWNERWPNISPDVVAQTDDHYIYNEQPNLRNGIGSYVLNLDALDMYQTMHEILGVRSESNTLFTYAHGYRSHEFNDAVGGAPHNHPKGTSFDIDIINADPEVRSQVLAAASQAGFNTFGIGDDRIHIQYRNAEFDELGPNVWHYNGVSSDQVAQQILNTAINATESSEESESVSEQINTLASGQPNPFASVDVDDAIAEWSRLDHFDPYGDPEHLDFGYRVWDVAGQLSSLPNTQLNQRQVFDLLMFTVEKESNFILDIANQSGSPDFGPFQLNADTHGFTPDELRFLYQNDPDRYMERVYEQFANNMDTIETGADIRLATWKPAYLDSDNSRIFNGQEPGDRYYVERWDSNGDGVSVGEYRNIHNQEFNEIYRIIYTS